MKAKRIKTKKQYHKYLTWIDRMFDKKVQLNTPQGDMVHVVLLFIQQYEDEYYSIPKTTL